jgi:hypothetical protein
MWIEQQSQHHTLITQLIIMDNVRNIFSYVQEYSGESKTETSLGGRGWFDKFKCRSNLHSLEVCSEEASSDIEQR